MEYQFRQQNTVVRRRYITRFELPGQDVPVLVVFEWGDHGWSGVTTFVLDTYGIEDMRVGASLYTRSTRNAGGVGSQRY